MTHLEEKAVSVWGECLRHIKTRISAQSYKTWFEPIKARKLENDNLTIQVPNRFFYEWLEEHHIDVLKEVVSLKIGINGRLTYAILKNKDPKQEKSTPKITLTKVSSYEERFNNSATHKTTFTGRYSLDNFIEGHSNRLAKSAASAIAENPGITAFNPLLMYSGVGLGKTHLLNGIGYAITKRFPAKKCLYLSSEAFMHQFIDGIRNNEIQKFMDYFVKIDVLLIDDIQFLAGKEKTQEMFFHIFNHIHQYQKQIVITSDCSPSQLKGLQERLLSRFRWGLTADIQKPDFETKLAIIGSKISQNNIKISDSLVHYIASSIQSNIRDLEGAIISIIAHASLNNIEITPAIVKQVIGNVVDKPETEVNIEYLHKLAAKHFNINPENLLGKTRKKDIVIARQMAMYLSKKYTNLSLKSIGEYYGKKHHTTVLHAIESIENMMKVDEIIKSTLNSMIEEIKLKMPSNAPEHAEIYDKVCV